MRHLAIILATCVTLVPIAGHAAAAPANDPPAPMGVVINKLGSITLGGIPITVNRLGDLTPGQSLSLEFILPVDTPAPQSLTVWTSNLNDPAAVNEVADKVEAVAGPSGRWTAKVVLPPVLNKNTSLWIALAAANGKPVSGSLPLQ